MGISNTPVHESCTSEQNLFHKTSFWRGSFMVMHAITNSDLEFKLPNLKKATIMYSPSIGDVGWTWILRVMASLLAQSYTASMCYSRCMHCFSRIPTVTVRWALRRRGVSCVRRKSVPAAWSSLRSIWICSHRRDAGFILRVTHVGISAPHLCTAYYRTTPSVRKLEPYFKKHVDTFENHVSSPSSRSGRREHFFACSAYRKTTCLRGVHGQW